MTTFLILIVLGIYLEFKFNPRLNYIKESKVLILYYNVFNSRDYVIIFRF